MGWTKGWCKGAGEVHLYSVHRRSSPLAKMATNKKKRIFDMSFLLLYSKSKHLCFSWSEILTQNIAGNCIVLYLVHMPKKNSLNKAMLLYLWIYILLFIFTWCGTQHVVFDQMLTYRVVTTFFTQSRLIQLLFSIDHASCSLAPMNMVTNFLHILDCSCFFHILDCSCSCLVFFGPHEYGDQFIPRVL